MKSLGISASGMMKAEKSAFESASKIVNANSNTTVDKDYNNHSPAQSKSSSGKPIQTAQPSFEDIEKSIIELTQSKQAFSASAKAYAASDEMLAAILDNDE